jgi:hypothetical protein
MWGSTIGPLVHIELLRWPFYLGCNKYVFLCFGRLSWLSNLNNTFVTLCKHLLLISCLNASSKLRLGVILVHLWVVKEDCCLFFASN